MEQDITELVSLAGHRNRYNIFIIGIVFLVWFNTSIVNYSLGFLESMPKVNIENSPEDVTLTYDICDSGKNYTITKEFDYSLFTTFKDNTKCTKIKVSLIGTVNSIGTTLGNLFFGSVSNLMGMRRHLVWYHVIFIIFLLIGTIFRSNYYVFQVVNLFAQYTCKSILNASLVLYNEIVDKKLKAIISGLINSALGVGGMFYVLMYLLIQKWYYVFIVSMVIALICALVIQFLFFDSMKESLINKDYDKFLRTIKNIAKKNGREKEFEEGIQTDKYRIILERLKMYTLEQDEGQNVPIQNNEEENNVKKDQNIDVSAYSKQEKDQILDINSKDLNPKDKEEVCGSPSVDRIDQNTERIKVNGVPKIDFTKVNNSSKQLGNENNEVSTVRIAKVKKPKGSCLDLVRYKSVRGKFLLICLFWFCNASLFYGLVIGIKSLKGSIFRNTAILYLVDFCAYNVSGFISNSKLGRKGTLRIFTLGYGVFSLVMFGAFKTKTVVLIFYFFARFSMMSAFCVYYTFAFESYPLSVASIGYGVNAGCNSLAGIIFPFIIEYIDDRYVFLIYGIFGCLCFGLIFLVPETKDVKIPDNIKEVEEKELKNSNSENDNCNNVMENAENNNAGDGNNKN